MNFLKKKEQNESLLDGTSADRIRQMEIELDQKQQKYDTLVEEMKHLVRPFRTLLPLYCNMFVALYISFIYLFFGYNVVCFWYISMVMPV